MFTDGDLLDPRSKSYRNLVSSGTVSMLVALEIPSERVGDRSPVVTEPWSRHL